MEAEVFTLAGVCVTTLGTYMIARLNATGRMVREEEAGVVEKTTSAGTLRRVERDSRRMSVALVALVVTTFAAGTFGFLSLRGLTASIREAQRERVGVQDTEIARLRAEIEARTAAEAQMIAYITKLAGQVKRLGGDPGTFTVQITPSPAPSR